MKKMVARILTILMILNLGVFPTAYGYAQYPEPYLYDSMLHEASFKFIGSTSGTLYYVVMNEIATTPTAADVRAMALAGTKTDQIYDLGSVAVTADTEGKINVTNIRGGVYKLFTTLETNGVLTAVTTKEFTTLFFEIFPEITQYKTDGFAVTSKFNTSGELYYGVYKDAEGVTANDVINDAANPNKVYTYHQLITNGVQSTTWISGLHGNSVYDIVFVRKDLYGNYSDVVTVLKDVKTLGNKLVNAVYTKADPYNSNDDRIYLYFSEPVDNAGTITDYNFAFVDESNTGKPGCVLSSDAQAPDYSIVGAVDNRVEIAIDPMAYESNLTYSNFSYGRMEVTLLTSGSSIQPAIVDNGNITSFTITEGVMSGYNSQPLMILAEYKALPDDGPDGDSIVITLDSPMYTSPAAVNFNVSVSMNPTLVDLILTPETDFVIAGKDDSSFYINFTSEGAIKLENLPTSFIKIAYNESSPPSGFSMFSPFIFTVRDSSVSTLKYMDVFGKSIPDFNPTVKEYTMSLPYAMLGSYNNTLAGAVHVKPNSMESSVFVMPYGTNRAMIEVMAADGTMSNYILNAVADELTLGGLAINDKKVREFDPFATTFAYTFTDVFTAAPTLTVAHSESTTVTVTSALSTSMANTYVYTIVLNKSGTEKTFTVTITGGASSSTPTDDKDDREPTTSPTTGDTTTQPTNDTATAPEPVRYQDPAKEITNFKLPTDLTNTTNLNNSLNLVKDSLNSVLTEKQAVETLAKLGDVVKQINTAMTAQPAEVKQLTQMVTNVTTGTEKKLSLITNPDQQLIVLDQLMVEVKLFKVQVAAPTPDLDKSVQELVQKTANNFGTLKIVAPTTAAPIKLDSANLATTIAKQTEAIAKLNELQKAYFETGIAKDIKKEIKIIAETPAGVAALKVELAPDQIGTLKEAKIEAFTVSNVNAEIKMPVVNLGPGNAVQLVIEKVPQQVATPQPGEPELVYDMALMVNNAKQEKFSKPITLAFSLVTFKLDNEAPEELAIFKKNPDTGAWEPVGGIVDPEGGKIFVTRDNLSQYTVLKSKKSFSDADQSWAKAEINAMLNKGIVSDTGKFSPQSVLTRGEFAQWIAKAYGLKVSSASLPFKDVAKDSDSYAAIAAVYEQGLLNGKSKTSFDPSAAVTQNEMAAALGKLLVSFDNKEKSGKVTSKYLSQLKTTQVASWAEDDMALLMELGLNTTGQNGKDPVTKEAAAAAFMKFYRS